MSNKKNTKVTLNTTTTLPAVELPPTVVTSNEVNNTPAVTESNPTEVLGTKYMVVGVGVVTLPVPCTLSEVQGKFVGLEVLPVTSTKGKGKGFTSEGKPYHGVSVITSPVSYVHTRVPQLLEEGYTRKQIINTLIEEGVTYYTACTQYQRYMSVSKGKL